MNHFAELAAVDVGPKLEKKAGLSYLSWAWAVDQLLRRDPNASWTYGEPQRWGDTVMVFCTVTAFGQSRTMQLPVMDHRNKAIPNPDAFAVNTAMQRCLVKAIALHGLGLYVYAGEDLPSEEGGYKPDPARPNTGRQVAQDAFDELPEDAQQVAREWAMEVIAMVEDDKAEAANEFLHANCVETQDKLAVWSQLPPEVRTKLKKAARPTQPTAKVQKVVIAPGTKPVALASQP